MINKVVRFPEEAIAGISDGASVVIGGFGGSGVPHRLINALIEQGSKGLTIVCNAVSNCAPLVENGRAKKLVCSFAAWTWRSRANPLVKPYSAGALEVEISPQGTLAERIHCGGSGIEVFYTPTGAGTEVTIGKEKRLFGDRECLLETALKADFALIKAFRADRMGNLVYRMSARNFNPIMATAAKVTAVEVEEIVETGELDPEAVVTPGIYVDRLVKVPKQHAIWLHRRPV